MLASDPKPAEHIADQPGGDDPAEHRRDAGWSVASYIADLVVALSLLCVLVGGFFTRFRLRFAGRPAQAGS